MVINHGCIHSMALLARTSVPLIWQFHNAISQKQIDSVLRHRKNGRALRFTGVSAAHIRALQPADHFSVIYNSVDTACYRPVLERTKDYLVYLGRLTPDKGVDIAIEVAARAGIPLKIAGNVPPVKKAQEYFAQRIQPRLGKNCEWIGPVDDAQKNELLGGAWAMLFPIQWEEPFGIVMIESLACGTPVIAARRASTPEVIRHGHTGWLCETVDEMVASVDRCAEVDRQECRRDVEARFSSAVMVERYLTVIDELLSESHEQSGWRASLT